MKLYEGMFLIDNALANNEWENVVNHIQDILTKHNSEILKIGKWEERKLAYKIGKHTRGTYLLAHFNAPNSEILSIRKECQISDKILRTLIVKAESNLLEKNDSALSCAESQKSLEDTAASINTKTDEKTNDNLIEESIEKFDKEDH